MDIPSRHIAEAVEQLASLPGIGRRGALRLALDLLKRSPEEIEQFSNAFTAMKQNVRICNSCGNISDNDICGICANPQRDHKTICIVEDIRDIMAIESTASFRGTYHVLGGVISPMDGLGPEDLNIASLIKKIESDMPDEIIFALSATMEGDTTNFYIYKKIQHLPIKVTTLSRGVAVGTELHYADELTLGRSMIQRMPFETTFSKP